MQAGLPTARLIHWFFLIDFLLTGRADLRLEYANTSSRSVPGAWYIHVSYPPIYHGEGMFGHHVGSDPDDFFMRMTGYVPPKLRLKLDFGAMT